MRAVGAQRGGPLLLDEIDRRLLNDFQSGFPLVAQPFAQIATALGIEEAEVISRLQRLREADAISRVGPVFRPGQLGVSTLGAMAVPPGRLTEIAALISAYAEVNHNYEREHRFNLWFVLTADNEDRLAEIMGEIEARTGIQVLDLPMLEEYHVDLGFRLQWT